MTQLPAPLLIIFPRPALPETHRYRAQCVFWDETLQAWSQEGMSLVRETDTEAGSGLPSHIQYEYSMNTV